MAQNALARCDSRRRGREMLHAVGLRCTEQRLAVLRELEGAGAPLSHRNMLEKLAHFRWDPATIFRNLNDLYEHGLLARIDVGDHVWRFELRGGEDRSGESHPHFLCLDCGTVSCLNDVSVADTTRRWKMPASVRAIDEVLLKGRCGACKSRK